ncbi:MAG: hypothetical protein QUS11_04775 [Candidatus Fermentibacter sp.]|nr:hypothetical protein [Candidatus Fermentibacter sp.]
MSSAVPAVDGNGSAAGASPVADARCRFILAELGLERDGSGYGLPPSRERPIIDSIELYSDYDFDGALSIVLAVHAGRTPERARLLFGSIHEKAVSVLYGEWIFIPEPVLACGPRIVPLASDLAIIEYIRGWKALMRDLGPSCCEAGSPAGALAPALPPGLVSACSAEAALSAIGSGDPCEGPFKVCPGICLKHGWRDSVAHDLEQEGALARCVGERLRQAFDILGESRV